MTAWVLLGFKIPNIFDPYVTCWLLTLNFCARQTRENFSNLCNLWIDVPDVWDLSDFHPTEGEDNVTFTQYAAVLLETQGIHRGPFAWLDNHLPPPSLSAAWLPARVGTQWVQMSYGPQMVSSSRLYRDNRPTRLSTIGIRLVNGFDEWSPDLASNLQHNQLQSISIGETYWWERAGWPNSKLALMKMV